MSSVLISEFYILLSTILTPLVNCDLHTNLHPIFSSYSYPQPPLTPIQLDEPSPLPQIYLPPIFQDESPFFPPPNPPYLPPDALPPLLGPLPPISNDDSIVVPAAPPQDGGGYMYPPPLQGVSPPLIRILNMSCVQDMHFSTVFRMEGSLPSVPIIDHSTEGCVSPVGGSNFQIRLESLAKMAKCGVKRCKGGSLGVENNMCVVVRVPTVRGVRLPEDGVVTLMCTPQERVVSQTRHVKLGTNKIVQNSKGRSANGFVATGGIQKDLKTHIYIFRKRPGTNVFDQNVQSDSVIQLGEELVLKATVNEDDGWKNTMVGPIVITGMSSKKSALLVNQNGCVNPIMKSICPQQPQKLTPLSTEVHFRAFLFQEAPQGDEMVVSVRMQGCLHSQDCSKANFCNEDSYPPAARNKRELQFNDDQDENKKKWENSTKEIKNWDSQFSFRVQPSSVPKGRNVFKHFENDKITNTMFFFYVFLIGIALSCIVIILLVCQICKKK